jgi:hypothetical protein
MGCGCQKNKSVEKDRYQQTNKNYYDRYAFLTPEQLKEKERLEAEKPNRNEGK